MKLKNKTKIFSIFCGFAFLLTAVSAPVISVANYTDQAKGVTPTTGANTVTTASATFNPTRTYIANTGTSIQDGTLWVWGFRGNGLAGTGVATVPNTDPPSAVIIPQAGYGGVYSRSVVKVAGVSLDNFYESDANYTGLAALSDDGIVYTWGGSQTVNVMGRTAANYYTPTAVNIPGTVVDLISSSGVFMALTSTGDLYTWGNAQSRGVTGQGTLTASAAVPTKILSNVHSIGSGTWNGWAIVGNNVAGNPNTGVLWWGWANPGGTGGTYAGDPSGDNLNVAVSSPTKSNALSALATTGCNTVGVVANSANDTCSLKSLTGHYFGNQALTAAGQIYTWGSTINGGYGNVYGTGRALNSLTDNVPTVAPIPNNETIVKVAPTEDYVILLSSTGKVYIYGRYNYSGPDPTTGAASTTSLQTVTLIAAFPGPVADIGGFGYCGAALLTNGKYYLWGGSQQAGNNNPFSSVRNGWVTTTTPTGTWQGLTVFTQPGM